MLKILESLLDDGVVIFEEDLNKIDVLFKAYPDLPQLTFFSKAANSYNLTSKYFCGIARYHSKLTFTEKRFIERLAREGYM